MNTGRNIALTVSKPGRKSNVIQAARIPTPIADLLSMVAMDKRISKKKILSDLSDEPVLEARSGAMFLASLAGHDDAAIAVVFDRDPAAVRDAIDGMERRQRVDPALASWFLSYSLVLTSPAPAIG